MSDWTYSPARAHHWSPDFGYFVHFEDKLYFENGEVRPSESKYWPGRMGLGGTECPEDYSTWTDQHRAEVFAKWKSERDEQRTRDRAWAVKQKKLCESAKAKLTEEEYNAVYSEGRDWA